MPAKKAEPKPKAPSVEDRVANLEAQVAAMAGRLGLNPAEMLPGYEEPVAEEPSE